MRFGSVLLLVVAVPSLADEPAFTKKTYTFKTVDGVAIHADVHRRADDKVRPVVVWLHGGALIMGSRGGVPKNLLELCRQEGYVLVSFDYRLAPETKLPGIIADVQDAFRWLQSEGPKLLHIDADRIVVSGGSAGGYLTMMTGICVSPRPRALVAYWGYGDVDGDWYTKPSEHYRSTRPLVTKETAYAAVGKGVPTGSDGTQPTQKNRGLYYLYLRQNGLWTKEVTGFDPATEPAKLDPFCPVRNITPSYPPILMVHGTKDTDVPYELSAAMAKELARHGVAHELVTVPDAEHGLAGGDKKLVAEAHGRALAFIRKHLAAAQGPKTKMLLTPAELDKALKDPKLRILDTRPKADYLKDHIPGAVWVDVPSWQNLGKTKGFKDAKAWGELVGGLGISHDSEVAVYGSTLTDTARVWWTLKYLGLGKVMIVDGGWSGWVAEKLATETTAPTIQASRFEPKFQADRLEEIESLKESTKAGKVKVVDARSADEFTGKQVKGKRGGHIPGAAHLEWKELLTDDGRFKTPAQLRELFRKRGILPESTAVCY